MINTTEYIEAIAKILENYGGVFGTKGIKLFDGHILRYTKIANDKVAIGIRASNGYNYIPLEKFSEDFIGRIYDFITVFSGLEILKVNFEERLNKFFDSGSLEKIIVGDVTIGYLGRKTEGGQIIYVFASPDETMATLTLMDEIECDVDTTIKDLVKIGKAIIAYAKALAQ